LGFLVRHAALSDLFEEAGLVLSPSELHGELCGLLCAVGVNRLVDAWYKESIGVENLRSPVADQVIFELRTLRSETWSQFAGSEMQFMPLLPNEDCAIDKRVEALGEWCHGFLSGVGLGGASLGPGTPEHVEEFLSDLDAFSHVSLGAEEDDNEIATDFMLAELIEYVRVGVQIIFEEWQSAGTEQKKQRRG
tara:strand:+ start:1333 stop:1908 length:576 start_codon:yes stop_codon:yes gene_type:complete